MQPNQYLQWHFALAFWPNWLAAERHEGKGVLSIMANIMTYACYMSSNTAKLIVPTSFTPLSLRCGGVVHCDFKEGRYVPPNKCATEGCRSRVFAPNRSSAQCIAWQKIRVQELIQGDQQTDGRVPRWVLWGRLQYGLFCFGVFRTWCLRSRLEARKQRI